jgi:hypothetical protein
MSESKVKVKDMRVGEFEYNLAEKIKSPISFIKRSGVYTSNFLFTCLQQKLEDMVLVENDVRLIHLTIDRLHGRYYEAMSLPWSAEKSLQIFAFVCSHWSRRT